MTGRCGARSTRLAHGLFGNALTLLAVLVPLPGSASELKVALQLSMPIAGAEPAPAVLLASAEATGELPAQIVEQPVTVPGITTLNLAAGRNWRLALRSSELWLPETIVLGSAGTESVTLAVWPLGTLEGQIALPADEQTVPEHLDALVTSAPEVPARQAFTRSAFRCPIQDGRWACRLPAGVVDLKLKARGFTPHYLWSLPLPIGSSTDLGKLALRRGSAVSGRIELDGAPKEGTRTKIELVPLETAQRPVEEKPGDVQRQVFRHESKEPNARGFFLFADVSPGGYEVVARHEGFADVSSGPVNVLENVEMELAEPLVLAPPLHVEALIEPPVDPWGDPWVIGLSRYGTGPIPRLISKTSAELSGWWRHEGLSPGEYSLEIGKPDMGAFHNEQVDLSRGSATLQIRVATFRVHGRVLLGKEPLEADLHFNNGNASLRLRSNQEGEFEGLLTEPGDWKLIAFARTMHLIKRVPRIEVWPIAGSAEAELLIELSDNRLRGRVVDEQGKAARATVFAISYGSDVLRTVATDKDGEFELGGLERGTFLLRAETPHDQASDQISTQTEDGVEPVPVELVVREKVSIEGRLLFEGVGAPEAELSALPAHAPLSVAATAASDVEGKFGLKLPKGTSHAALTVKARGFALRMLTVPVEPGKPLEVPLSQVSGNLSLEFPQQPDLDYGSGVTYCLLRNGTCIAVQFLINWARANGGKGWVEPLGFSIPNLEPGVYAFCSVKNTDLVATMLGAPPPGRCVSGTVVPGGELSLKVPAPPKLE